MRRPPFTDEEWKAIMRMARHFQFATRSIDSTNKENQNMSEKVLYSGPGDQIPPEVFNEIAKLVGVNTTTKKETKMNNGQECNWEKLKAQIERSGNEIYNSVFKNFAKEDLSKIANKLAKKLLNEADMKTEKVNNYEQIWISARVDVAEGNEASNLFWKIWNCGSIMSSFYIKIFKKDPADQIINIDTTQSPKTLDGGVSFTIKVEDSNIEGGCCLDTLINAVKEIDKRVEDEAEHNGFDYEKVYPTADLWFALNLSKDNKLTADVTLMYMCERKEYEVSQKINDQIVGLFEKLAAPEEETK